MNQFGNCRCSFPSAQQRRVELRSLRIEPPVDPGLGGAGVMIDTEVLHVHQQGATGVGRSPRRRGELFADCPHFLCLLRADTQAWAGT